MIPGNPELASYPLLPRLLPLALVLGQPPLGPSPSVWLDVLPTVIGEPSIATVEPDETLLDVAFRHRIGFEQLIRLNPDIDVWIPDAGTTVTLPTEMIPPAGGRKGLVINLPEMRLYDFNAPGGTAVLAIAIGDEVDPTPIGEFRVGEKRIDPVWTVPESIRMERPGLPARVPPGPENPLGDRWMTLGATSYGIHGTNNRWSIGRMATHGCVRLYEDAARDLYDRTPRNTPVAIVYQSVKIGRRGDRIYLEAHPDIYGRNPDPAAAALARLFALGLYGSVDPDRVRQIVDEALGIPVLIGVAPPQRTPSDLTS